MGDMTVHTLGQDSAQGTRPDMPCVGPLEDASIGLGAAGQALPGTAQPQAAIGTGAGAGFDTQSPR